ncbi:MAG: GGDEF domain-containing protein [Nitrospira sp.]|nr:GGDEF domain-containing protein [bacterium]MBL7049097.1 GGDEF domain-containing protein [Nitrospira sp.]
MGKSGQRILLVDASGDAGTSLEKSMKDQGAAYESCEGLSLQDAGAMLSEEGHLELSLYKDIIRATNILIWRTDKEGRFTFLNKAWEDNCGYSLKEMLGKPFSEFQLPEASEYYVNVFRNCLIGESVSGQEITILSKQGAEIFLILNMIPLYDAEGLISGTQGAAVDISERKNADELLQYICAKDELTGLYNLHTFMSMTEQQIKTAHREEKEMLIIYAGIDNMHGINEECGMDAGDQVLIDMANIFRRTFREADVLARSGGDEFVMSTVVSSKNTAEMIMTRLHDNIEQYNNEKIGPCAADISFGRSFYSSSKPVSIDELLSKADASMHQQKKGKKLASA